MWQPNQNDLQQIFVLLNESQIANNEKQKQIFNQFQELSKNSEFFNYLVLVISLKNEVPQLSRHVACATLNSLIGRKFQNLNQETLNYIKQKLIENFADEQLAIRRGVGTCITSIIILGGFQQWPQLLQFFFENLDKSQDLNVVENTIDCIGKIIEDLRQNSENFAYFDNSQVGEAQTFEILIPKLFQFCDIAYNSKIREKTLYSLNLCIFAMPPALAKFIYLRKQKIQLRRLDNYVSILIEATSENEAEMIQIRGIQGLVALIDTKRDFIFKNIQKILQVVVSATRVIFYQYNQLFIQRIKAMKQRKTQAYSGQNFLLKTQMSNIVGFNNQNHICQCYTFQSNKFVFSRLLPAILDGIKYEQEDLINASEAAEQEQHSQKKLFRIFQKLIIDLGMEEKYKVLKNEQDQEEQKDFFDRGEYTLRILCGQTLKKIAEYFRDDVFKILQPSIDVGIQSTD